MVQSKWKLLYSTTKITPRLGADQLLGKRKIRVQNLYFHFLASPNQGNTQQTPKSERVTESDQKNSLTILIPGVKATEPFTTNPPLFPNHYFLFLLHPFRLSHSFPQVRKNPPIIVLISHCKLGPFSRMLGGKR